MSSLTPPKPTIYISTLGRFELTLDGVTMSGDAGRSGRIWNLLAYLIVHRKKTSPRRI